jgi:hypothetical protein
LYVSSWGVKLYIHSKAELHSLVIHSRNETLW